MLHLAVLGIGFGILVSGSELHVTLDELSRQGNLAIFAMFLTTAFTILSGFLKSRHRTRRSVYSGGAILSLASAVLLYWGDFKISALIYLLALVVWCPLFFRQQPSQP